MSRERARVTRRTARTGLLRTWMLGAGALVLIDVWQVALRLPRALSLRTALGVIVVYGACAAIGCGVAAAGVGLAVPAERRRLGFRGPPTWAIGVTWTLAAIGVLGATRGFGYPRTDDARPASRRSRAVDGKPNVLLVVVDTLRADHMSCYGYDRRTTPFLDGLAAEGVLFGRAIAQSSWTRPSIASLLTARFPTMSGAMSGHGRVPESEILLTETLRDHGYRTALFSANPWVSPGYGFAQGADTFYLAPSMRGWSVTLLMKVLRRANRLVDPEVRFTERVRALLRNRSPTTARDDVVAAEALDWLDAGDDRPFFLYVHFVSPHAPYDPPSRFVRAFDDDPDGPVVTEAPRKPPGLLRRAAALAPRARRDLIARYDGSILYVDGLVRALVEKARERDPAGDTIVVVVADHGEEFHEHGSWGHGQSLYQELIHVPLIVSDPGALPRGVRVDRLVMVADVAPTILELARIPGPPSLAGRSLVPLLAGASAGWVDEAYAEVRRGRDVSYALLWNHTKVVHSRRDGREFVQRFDLATDPRERQDLSRAGHRGPIDERLESLRAWAEGEAPEGTNAAVPAETARALRELGYLDDPDSAADMP